MAAAVASPPTGDLLREMIAIIERIAGKHARGSATSPELAIARAFVELMLASADLGESFVTEELSQGLWTDVNRLRRACHQYELRLWQTAPAFLLAQ